MYTSGSTGEPKGVAVEHRGITRLVRGAEWIDLDANTVTLQHSSVSFDASTFEIWAPLLNGGTLVLRDGESADVEGLVEQVRRDGVNTLWLSAGVLPLWVDRPESADVRLRYLLAGGDVVSERHVREVYARDPHVVVINGYGPTENTTFSCCYTVPRDIAAAGSLPIGRPITGTDAYVLDDRMQLQPVGCAGELYVGGPGLARGYLNKPELTARAFVAHPFSDSPQDRLYRTGDRVRWLVTGDLEFLGRADNQVKIRGYRVELDEIELHLMQLPDVKTGAVAVREDSTLGKRLVAYVAVDGASLDDRDAFIGCCKASLRKTLPDYMVPGTFVVCDELPLTPNGKVDRRRLPDPSAEDVHRQEYRAPRTETERALCAIWGEVLRVERVGVDDSFFDLGGHSLLATQLVARIRERLSKTLPLGELFQNPTVAGVAAHLDAQLDGNRAAGASEELPSIVADEDHRYDPFPMTAVQQAYWLGRSGVFELGNISTHSYIEVELYDFDLGRFERAWNALIERHDMLRAVFASDGTQRILPVVPRYTIACEDLRGRSAAEQQRHLERVRDHASHQIFDATQWPLFEVRASRLSDRLLRLHFSMDALPSDAMSSMLLVRELDQLYADPLATLPPLAISFRDYVLGLDAIRASALYEQSRAYWEKRAPELPSAPDLPLAKDPVTIARPRFRRRYCVLERAQWDSLQERARAAGVTPSALLVSAFSRVLERWSRSRHFTLTLTLFNRLRVHPQVEELVGDFTSLIPLEIDDRGRKPLGAFSRDVQSRLWSDMDHRYFDGIEVMRLLNRRSGSGKPVSMPVVFTSTLGLPGDQTAGTLERALSDLSQEGSYGITQTSQVWLDNVVGEAQGKLTITWDALEELFPAGVLDAMFAAYRSLLEELAAGRVGLDDFEQPLLPREQADVRRYVNATEGEMPAVLLQDLFREQVSLRGNAPAVTQGDVTLDFAELDRRARAVAHALRERGAGRNELVAIVMVKGWEQAVAALGILYAGAAYLPIDAALPAERIALLLAQGEARIAIRQSDVAVALPETVDVIAIDRGAVADVTVPPSPAQPDDLAYVIFTSGSTGMPKGVMIDHGGAVNTVVDINRRFNVGSDDRVLGLSSLSFDLSVYDIFGVIGAGGTLVLPDRSRERDTTHWVDIVQRHGVTVWNTVPVLAQLFADDAQKVPGAGASLRVVLMSGDWIPLPLPARLNATCPNATLVSLGGATEASIWSNFHVIERVEEGWTSIPYGRPLTNQRFHVLSPDLSAAPDWVPGDLFIAGTGLAKGYWRDAEKTQRSFFEHPATGERLYRTGDLGRYWPDGTIEFLGREDTQVKVHGHRIELGEIEAALSQHERVAAAAVVAAGERSERRLVAYVVASDGADPDVDELRDFLRAKLPAYMVPSAFVALDRLPLNQNGKVDRKALPKAGAIPQRAAHYEAPRNELEASIADKWIELLQVERVSVVDDFFEIGGDSLGATRFVSAMRNTFPADAAGLSLETFFGSPTIAAVADLIGAARNARRLDEIEAQMALDGELIEEGRI
jgi:amino acid adenylation domain-containing protein